MVCTRQLLTHLHARAQRCIEVQKIVVTLSGIHDRCRLSYLGRAGLSWQG